VELRVPSDAAGRFARCGACQHRFEIPSEASLSDEDIISLISTTEDMVDATDFDDLPDDESERSTIMAAQVTAAGSESDIRLVKLSQSGAMLEFPAKRLRDISFRCGMPRVCMRCSAKSNLHARVMVYATPLIDAATLHSLLDSDQLVYRAAHAERLSAKDLMDHLPAVPNSPEPAELPMPYWMCDACDPEGLVVGHLIEDAKTGDQTCRLHMRNIPRARDFLQAVHADEGDLAKLAEWCKAEQQNPWDLVPRAIRQRLMQWFRSEPGERFLAYIPDRGRSRQEEGMAGVVVSDQRLIAHSHLRHKEAVRDLPLRLQLTRGREHDQLTITTSQWKVLRMPVDREGVRLLRRALTLGKFQAVWT